jgi:hypothetical protein
MNRGILWSAAALALFCGPLAATGLPDSGDVSISVPDDGPGADCSRFRTRFEGREAVRSEQSLTLPRSASPLSGVRLPEHSGIWIHGSDRSDYAIRICKAAATSETLANIRAGAERGRLSVDGPASEDWAVHFIVEAPREAVVDLDASSGPVRLDALAGRARVSSTNGPLALSRLTGTVVAEAENGPISLRECSGEVRARAVNGPISISGSGGTVHARTENGPISVWLRGAAWENGGIEAEAINGPVSLRIPPDYRSGTRLESSGNAPLQCRGRACEGARRTQDGDSRALELGESNPVVRLSSVHGPVTVRESSPE